MSALRGLNCSFLHTSGGSRRRQGLCRTSGTVNSATSKRVREGRVQYRLVLANAPGYGKTRNLIQALGGPTSL